MSGYNNNFDLCSINFLFYSNHIKGEKVVPVLFREQDGVWIYIQGKDRPKGKNKKKELKLEVSYI